MGFSGVKLGYHVTNMGLFMESVFPPQKRERKESANFY